MKHLPREVFLSHSHHDHDFVLRLAEALTKHGIPVWYSERNIVGAQQWHDEIGQALARCDWFVLVLSPDAVESKWVKHELLYALNDQRYADHIVPLLYQACDMARLSWTLPSFQRVEFTKDFHVGCRELLRVWGTGYRA